MFPSARASAVEAGDRTPNSFGVRWSMASSSSAVARPGEEHGCVAEVASMQHVGGADLIGHSAHRFTQGGSMCSKKASTPT
jgi:hypothetical protein